MNVLRSLTKKALTTGAGVVLPVAFRAYEKAVASPAGPLIDKAVETGEKIASPFLELLGFDGGDPVAPEGGLEDRGSVAEPRQVTKVEVAEEPIVELAPKEAPITAGLPMPTYDHMEMPAILDALNGLTVAELRVIREHESEHEDRGPIIDRIDELLSSVDAPV